MNEDQYIKIYNVGYNTEMINKQRNAGDPLETPGGLYQGPSSMLINVNTIQKMRNIKSGAMFDYYECQAIIEVRVVSVVSVQSFQLASARKSFEAGFGGWLSAVSGVRLCSETEITTSSSIYSFI